MVFSSALNDFNDVCKNCWINMDCLQCLLHCNNLLWRSDLFDVVSILSTQLTASKNCFFFSTVWVTHTQLHEETVHLRFWKRICSFLFDWVLSCKNNERSRKFVRDTFDGHLLLFHCFKQSSLGLWRSTVNLVSKKNIREQWTCTQLEFTRLLVVHVGSHDV